MEIGFVANRPVLCILVVGFVESFVVGPWSFVVWFGAPMCRMTFFVPGGGSFDHSSQSLHSSPFLGSKPP
jgi:hypothetical protein